MKKISLKISALILILVLGIAGCGPGRDKKTSENKEDHEAKDHMDLDDMMDFLTKDLDMPMSTTIYLDEDNFKDYSFIDWEKGLEGVCLESQISSVASSLVLVETEDKKGEDLAKEMADKVDVGKWICVFPEASKILYTDDYVFMIMTFDDLYEGLAENFKSLLGAENVQEIDIKSGEDL